MIPSEFFIGLSVAAQRYSEAAQYAVATDRLFATTVSACLGCITVVALTIWALYTRNDLKPRRYS